MTEDEMEYVKDRACFIVAAKAFGQGEFYLKVELADPRALRSMYAWFSPCLLKLKLV
jgi:hypothetical protein